jgi:hypothetical protein
MDPAAVAAGRENWTCAGDLVRLLAAVGRPGVLDDAVRRPVLDGMAASQHLAVLGEVVPEERLLGVKGGSLDYVLHDCGLIARPDGPVAVALCSWPRASQDALRAAARTVLEPYLD